MDKRALEMLFAALDYASQALLLSQSGEGASCVLTTVPSCPEFDVPNDEYRVVLLRRLRLPLPLAPRRCRCGGRLDALGDHRSACAQAGVLAHRAGPVERAAARICRETGARVATHVALCDMNLDAPATDSRSSRTACTCAEVPKSRSTQRSSAHCRAATSRRHGDLCQILVDAENASHERLGSTHFIPVLP